MSGWDTSSRPTWGQSDGQDDPQTHSDPDNSAAEGNPWDRPSGPQVRGSLDAQEADGQGFGSGGFSDQANGYPADGGETAAGYPRRIPGRTLGQQGPGQPGPNQPGSAGPGQPERDQPGGGRAGFGQQDLPRREARGRHSGTGPDQPGAVNPAAAPWEGSAQQPGSPARTGALGQPNDDSWGQPVPGGQQGRSVPPWDKRPRDAGRQELGAPDFGAPDFGRPDLGRPDLGRADAGRPDLSRPDLSRPDLGGPSFEPRWQDADRSEPGRPDRGRPNADFPGPQDQQRPDADRSHSARPDDFRPPLPPPGQRGLIGYPDPEPGRGGRLFEDGWDAPPRSSRPPLPPDSGESRSSRTGAIRAMRGGDDEVPGFGKRVYLTVGAILALIVVVVVILMHQHSGKSAVASGTSGTVLPPDTIPSSTPSTPKTTATPSKPGKPTAAQTTKGHVLSTPATAGGYPAGQDPHFLATATGTATQIVGSVTSGGGGTVKGSPVSAAYQLPTDGQVMTFVGYEGTFSPAKIATLLGSLGTDQNTYPAGADGGTLGCANTPASGSTPSGAVCVWADASTMGITEFFSSTAPEVLTASQDKGAADTVKLRASVEATAS